MQTRSFRFHDDDVELLRELAKSRGESQADTLHYALIALQSGQKPANNNNDNAALISFLTEQITIKDSQIESMSKQLDNITTALMTAQENTKGAQLIHAHDMDNPPQLENAEGNKKRKWWKFWTD